MSIANKTVHNVHIGKPFWDMRVQELIPSSQSPSFPALIFGLFVLFIDLQLRICNHGRTGPFEHGLDSRC